MRNLGSASFKSRYGLELAYLSGGMYKAIASKELVVRMAKSGCLSFYGSGGCRIQEVMDAVHYIQRELSAGQPYGMNLVCSPTNPDAELELVELFLRYGVRIIEAAAFMQMTPALVVYRLNGLRREGNGEVVTDNKIIGKTSRIEIAKMFLSPAPQHLLDSLLASGKITIEQFEMAKEVPMADDLCAEADSGGHTDMGVSTILLPSFARLRDEIIKTFNYREMIHVGSSGGIGTPEAAASAFIMGADFVMTGSINQCTVEAGTSDTVKDMLQQMNVHDTDYAPAGDMFELGAKVQVMKRGVFFSVRANKLYDLWRLHDSIDDLDEKTRCLIEEKYFKRSFEEVYAETKEHYLRVAPEEIAEAESRPKHKMALIFRWYFVHASRLALKGDLSQKVDYQVHSGPALGAFNQWVKNTPLENWHNRHVDELGKKIMSETAKLLSHAYRKLEQTIN